MGVGSRVGFISQLTSVRFRFSLLMRKNQVKKIYVPHQATSKEIGFGVGSIFLAGPTPRDDKTKSWRPEFIEALRKTGIDCSVLIPECEHQTWLGNYEKQCQWEYDHLHKSTAIIFWVPRDLVSMPAFTTNVEFGYWLKSAKTFYGRPDGAPKTSYLDWMYQKEHKSKPSTTMDELVGTVSRWLLG